MIKKTKRDEIEYRIVSFKRRNNKKGYLEGIEYARKKLKGCGIVISNWIGWDTSFWVKITGLTGQVIILDSGVIEQLSDEIKRLKKTGLVKSPLDRLFVINNPKDIY